MPLEILLNSVSMELEDPRAITAGCIELRLLLIVMRLELILAR